MPTLVEGKFTNDNDIFRVIFIYLRKMVFFCMQLFHLHRWDV